jgi:glycosyltransferase involved in cell wall biosynthesis
MTLQDKESPRFIDSEATEFTILMPCLNESETLETCIRQAVQFLQREDIRGEVLVADNGSTDGSQEIARRCGARVLDVKERGYGSALHHGVLSARGRFVIMGDADDSYDFSELGLFVSRLREGFDLVMGNRFMGGILPGAMPWKNRWIGNPVLSGIGRLLFRCNVGDFHCGLRGFRRDALRELNLRTTGMEFASEMVIRATLANLRIVEVPTTLRPDGRSRAPHLRPWRDGWRHLRFMLLYSPRWLFFYPGLVIMVASFIGSLALTAGPVQVGRVVFDVHTLLFAAIGILVGFQLVFFALFSSVFVRSEGLLPPDKKIERISQLFSFELGLLLGGVLVVGGAAGSISAFSNWQALGFRELNVRETFRVVIPSVLSIAIGIQVIFSGFLLSVLGLRVRTRDMPGEISNLSSEDA